MAPHRRLDEALAYAREATMPDPLSQVAANSEAELLMMNGAYAGAIDKCGRMFAQDAA